MTSPYLSIIIPAYNEANRLPATLGQVCEFMQRQPFESELIIVENGSQDATFEIAQKYAGDVPHVQVIHEERRGKGLAVKRGMLMGRGEYLFMCDADLSMPVDEIPRFLPPRLENFDVAIASREALGARRYNEPTYRHLGGRAINLLIRMLALPGLNDTQCGFKCFQKHVAEDLFQSMTFSGWSFDIEVLYIARLRGYRIVELPIQWFFNPESKLELVKDTLRMAQDLVKIRHNHRQGVYYRSL